MSHLDALNPGPAQNSGPDPAPGCTTIQVRAEQPYPVLVGRGLAPHLQAQLEGATRVAVVAPAGLADTARAMVQHLEGAHLLVVPDGEAAKTPSVLVELWQQVAEIGLTRDDLVVGVGGGTTTDLAGFLAASWLRGVGHVLTPTSLLAMVDAAVGGKTGINLPAGKNLVGAFHEPRAVVCDLDFLTRLPRAELVSGMAEVVKCGFIADQRILEGCARPSEALDPTGTVLADLVERAIRVKAETVASDLREATSSGNRVGREALNFGHTLGHAIEQVSGFTWRHGEAISVGMVFAAELSARTLGLPADQVDRVRTLLTNLGLPTSVTGMDWTALRTAMGRDKKTRGSRLRLVGLEGFGSVRIIDGPDEDLLAHCYSLVVGPTR